jgi:molecular chaperone HscB
LNCFDLFGLPARFELDRKDLDSRFHSLQSQLHPDRFASATSAEQRRAAEQSMMVNEAYQVLKDPIQRSLHLCELARQPVQLEVNTAMSKEFLISQMEMRESLADSIEAGDSDAVEGVIDQAELARRERLALLNAALGEQADYNRAGTLIKELMFFSKLSSEAQAGLEALQTD